MFSLNHVCNVLLRPGGSLRMFGELLNPLSKGKTLCRRRLRL